MLLRQELNSRRRAAFTLMEMLVVVAIIVALAGIGGYALLAQLESAKKDTAQIQVKGALSQACKTYSIKHGVFPESLQALTVKDEYKTKYIDNPDVLFDPWKKPYVYDKTGDKNSGDQPDIYCVAPDGTIIGNWPMGNKQ